MKTRNELINYFMNSFKSEFRSKEEYYKTISSKATEELNKAYHLEQLRKNNEQMLHKHGTDAYMIEYSKEEAQDIANYMWNNGMFKIYDDRVVYDRFKTDGLLYYVPLKFVEELEKHFNIFRSKYIHILGKSELNNFSVGDKVKIKFNNWYGDTVEQGTVHSINDDEIVIRKYRARAKGFTLKAGEECNIEKINSFVKVS